MEISEDLAVLNADNYKNVMDMMLSNDEGSVNVAYAAIDNMDFLKSVVYLLILIKEANEERSGINSIIEDKAPQLYKNLNKFLEARGEDILNLSFESIYLLCEERENEEEMLFLLDLFKDKFTNLLVEYGFSFMKYVDVQIKPKTKNE